MRKNSFRRVLTALVATTFSVVSCLMAPAAAVFAGAEESPDPTAMTAGEENDEGGAESAAPASEDEHSVSSYEEFVDALTVLEEYADSYYAIDAQKKHDAGELVLNFVRTGVERYQDDNWETLGGAEITSFVTYVAEQDAQNGTTAMILRNIEEFEIPNGDSVDFGHMFGTMNISYLTRTATADLSGWAGDICDLLNYCYEHIGEIPEGTVEDKVAYISENCFGVDAPGAYGWNDFYGDLDGFYLVAQMKDGVLLSDAMEEYFTEDLTDVDRSVYFLNNRFGDTLTAESTLDDVRAEVFQAYKSNVGLQVLEAKRGLSDLTELREACCYTFADYVYSQAEGLITGNPDAGDDEGGEGGSGEGGSGEGGEGEGGSGEGGEGGEGGEDPDDGLDENRYYSVFSSTDSTLAPGITQTVKYAYTADNKQIVYYLATVDVSRDDVSIHANYNDNDPSSGWSMSRVQDQMEAAQERHSDPDSDFYVENYSAVVGVNADFFNMSNGKPSGALVMEGVKYNGVGSENFFAILDDGSAVIGAPGEWNTYADRIVEAVGGSVFLVKNGKSVIAHSDGYYSNRASRTCVGITEDGEVVLMVLDGRQEPFSAGGSMQELAQIMLDAGCVTAINLDGGGSTTFVAKPEGSDDLTVVSRPSDGYARSVSSSLLVVSTAVISYEFDHAVISTDYDYLTVGTELALDALGVSASGHAADIPEDAVWELSDPTLGTIEDDVFTADALGDVEVRLVSGGEIVGSKMLHVVVPDKLRMTQSTMNIVYDTWVEFPLEATFEGNSVAFKPSDVYALLQYSNAGEVDGLKFKIYEASEYRSLLAGAALIVDGMPNESISAMLTLNVYKANETVFDFDNAIAGDRTFAWDRDVTNSTTVDNVNYQVKTVGEEMEISYIFALDMEAIPIPDKLADLTYMLPGADLENACAWNFLLQLAERVSVLTKVTITAQFDMGLDVDISDLTIANDYFTMASKELDETTNTVTVIANWVDQTMAIDPVTANPACILSGIKAVPKDDANWSNDKLTVVNSGDVSYDIYLRASSLYSFANIPENQELYGLIPFENPDVIIGGSTEKGASFSDVYATFHDTFTLLRAGREGWYSDGNSMYYYKNNEKVTGIHLLPSQEDPSVKLYYNFGNDGGCNGTVTGFFGIGDDLFYAVRGEGKSGWQTLTGASGDIEYYYFDPSTGAAVNGVKTIGGYTYTFTDKVLTKGQLVTDSTGTRYRWAGTWATQAWLDLDGREAYAQQNGYFMTGLWKRYYKDGELYFFAFGEDGFWMKDYTGLYEGDTKEGYGKQTYLIVDGYVQEYPGLVKLGEDYYYFISRGYQIRNTRYWVDKPNGIVKSGYYEFDAEGKMITTGVSMNEPKAKVSGSLTSYLDTNGTVTIQLFHKGDTTPTYETTFTGNSGSYSFASVPVGDYTMVVSKKNHVSREYDFTMISQKGDVELNVKLNPVGDVTGDGVIMINDVNMLYGYFRRVTTLSTYALLCGDFNGDGKVLINEVNALYSHFRKQNSLWK